MNKEFCDYNCFFCKHADCEHPKPRHPGFPNLYGAIKKSSYRKESLHPDRDQRFKAVR